MKWENGPMIEWELMLRCIVFHPFLPQRRWMPPSIIIGNGNPLRVICRSPPLIEYPFRSPEDANMGIGFIR